MGLFFPEDPHFDETKWQTGFYRYRQLLSARFGQWWRINLLTLAGFAPPWRREYFTPRQPPGSWCCCRLPSWAA